jgi:putative hemolysin
MQNQQHETPFRLTGVLDNRLPAKALTRSMEGLLERVFSLQHLERLYRALPPSNSEQEFLQQVFETFNINYEVDAEELARIPTSGPLVIVANHPFGAIEGVIMAAMLAQVRPGVKIMANFILKRIPEVRDRFIAVNPFGGKGATRSNARPLKEALQWLQQGGCLVVFPAGEVSHLKPGKKTVSDPPWSPSIGRLIQLAQAPVQSVYFHGANSLLFQLAGLVHPILRTALLPRELIRRANTTIPIRIGKSIAWQKIKEMDDAKVLIDYLRLRTYMLRNSSVPKQAHATPALADAVEPIAPVNSEVMECEVAAIPAHQLLVENGAMQVYYAGAKQIPDILQDIGRLREVTFREVGEGTGKAVDLDYYDDFYLHLFIWNQQDKEIVGAYRLGQADKIVGKQGMMGLYSHSLFNYSQQLVDQLNPALELGRSFVRMEYQKSFAPLMLLWKGIGQYVALNPQYRKLFGPVSISSDYQPLSQQLLVDFLRANNSLPELARLVKPRRPFKARATGRHDGNLKIESIEGVGDLIAEIEQDEKGVPILLKQYLKLGGQVLEFNVDDQFNNALDGLIMVDLLATDRRTLAKYMGRDGVERFYKYHQSVQEQVA